MSVALADARLDAPTLTTVWHAYTWLWFMAGVVALYLVVRALGASRPIACVSSLFLYLSPRFFAEGHYNNKDVLLLSLVLLTLAVGARFLQEPTYPRALLLALFGAMATNTKIIGALAFGLIGLATLIRLIARRELTAKRVRAGLAAILLYAVFYAALTPALWADPLGYLRYLVQNATSFTRWTGVVVYGGQVYDPTRGLPLPRSYLPMMILCTTPLVYLAFAVIGQLRALPLIVKRDDRTALLIVLTLLWLVPVGYAVWKQPLFYNGWRHFYFLYAGVAALAGLGLQSAANALRGKPTLRIVGAALLTVCLLWVGGGIVYNHPHSYAYYNELIAPERAETDYELDYWDVSTVGAMKRLTALEDGALTLTATDEMSWFGVEHGYAVLPDDVRQRLTIVKDAPGARYLLANTTYARIYGVTIPAGYEPLFAIRSYGATLCTVYRAPEADAAFLVTPVEDAPPDAPLPTDAPATDALPVTLTIVPAQVTDAPDATDALSPTPTAGYNG